MTYTARFELPRKGSKVKLLIPYNTHNGTFTAGHIFTVEQSHFRGSEDMVFDLMDDNGVMLFKCPLSVIEQLDPQKEVITYVSDC